LVDFGVSERASAFHQSSNVEGQVVFAPSSSLIRSRELCSRGHSLKPLRGECKESQQSL
jgi:hypothetical protein